MLPKNRSTLAAEYGISRKTFAKLLKAIPHPLPHTLTAPWQKLIYRELGYPGTVDPTAYNDVRLPYAASTDNYPPSGKVPQT